MRFWAGGATGTAIALVQTSSMEHVRVFGVSPNLALALVLAWLVVRGLDDALPLAGVTGVALGMLSVQNPGVTLLAMVCAVAIAGAVRESGVLHSELLIAASVMCLASLVYEGVLLLSAIAAGGGADIAAAARHAMLPAAAVNLGLGLPVYVVIRFAAAPPRRRAYAF